MSLVPQLFPKCTRKEDATEPTLKEIFSLIKWDVGPTGRLTTQVVVAIATGMIDLLLRSFCDAIKLIPARMAELAFAFVAGKVMLQRLRQLSEVLISSVG